MPTEPRRAPSLEAKIPADVKGALLVAACLTVLGVAVGDSTLGVLLSPVVFALMLYAMSRVPLRVSLMALMFLALTLENPADGPAGGYESPLRTVGAMMLNHLNTIDRSIGISQWMSFSGMDLCLVSLLFIAASRRRSGSRIDRRDALQTPRPLVRLAYISLWGAAWVWLVGFLAGGDFAASLWQLDRVMYLPIVFLLFHMGLRGPKDNEALAKVVLSAAAYKALLAVYIVKTVHGPMDPATGSTSLPHATSHADSILFAGASVLVLAMLLERATAKPFKLAFSFLPILIAGIIANNRRMAWVQVGLVFLTTYLVTRDNPVKRKVRRVLWVSSPLTALYLLIGWNANGSIFKPVRILRSVADAKSDSSSFWRELENFNLIQTVRMNPILGTGYGHGYQEVVAMPAIDYTLEKFIPHNSILGLWAYCGYIGYTAMTLLWVAGVYFSMRAYHNAKNPSDRAASLVSFGAILIYLVQCWGDMGLGTWAGVFTVGPALAVGGKLAIATGAWTPSDKNGSRRVGLLDRLCS